MSTPDPELLRLAREWLNKNWINQYLEVLLAAFASSPEVREYLERKAER